MPRPPLLRVTASGLYCEAGGFHIDPSAPVAKAVISHAHGDHAVPGSARYLTTPSSARILQHRMGKFARVEQLPYGKALDLNGVRVSFHPAGHVLGSAQVRVEHQGEVWVFSGDYRTTPNNTCEPFEPVPCQTFITESTFGRPYFAWPELTGVVEQIHAWWRDNQARGHASFLYAYAFGKAQRLLALLNPDVGPIFVHPKVAEINAPYREQGIALPPDRVTGRDLTAREWGQALVILPPAIRWQPDFPFHGHFSTAFASGWMLFPNESHRRRVDTGFVVSDHADYGEILSTIRATGAEQVHVMHGYVDDLTADLRQQGIQAHAMHLRGCRTPPALPVT